MATKQNLWSREELILALNLYLQLEFGKFHSGNPDIIHLASIIGRTPSSVSMRLSNFATVDPYHQKRGVGGLPGGRKQVEPIWNEFINNRDSLLFESEKILAEKEHISIEKKFETLLKGTENLKGETRIREVKTRVNQDAFRRIVLAAYNYKCCITGINQRELLVAGHIMMWSKDEKNRLNFSNGLAMNKLHDSAFEAGLITITPEYKVKISSVLKKQSKLPSIQNFFIRYDNEYILKPSRFLPDVEFLRNHNKDRFIK